ncbi:PREDICTED: transmembrane ascorbate ferrireductase 1-like isoform X1 [Nicotiana attenuata]|uniref:Transmembrane ascorbate ferrireductase 1 n=1 Tax=Nicotiana attenuata TaxID=49451 RepID=A0A314KSZ3_NICAT|nr:PREDICTED: transmembrane ascorbate ferrireductase 1-like isoform X1 [Nicotiana attenuata]OIT32335.1 transmembrane ascorbate ferrireductase 1 [Nicotiana attenuata]
MGLKALPFSFGARFLALVAAIMVLVWSIHFRGGLAWEADNKNLIFNWIYGFVVFFYPGGSDAVRRDSLPWHVLFRMFVYVMAVGNACLGFLEKLTFLEVNGLAKYGSEAFRVNFTAIATVLYGVFVFLTSLSQAGA